MILTFYEEICNVHYIGSKLFVNVLVFFSQTMGVYNTSRYENIRIVIDAIHVNVYDVNTIIQQDNCRIRIVTHLEQV